jgi:hypothetical protein
MENEVTEHKVDRKKLLAEVNERIKELDDLQETEDMIRDNTIEFQFDLKTYRVRKPGRRERQELREIKNKKKNQLLRDPENVTEEELIQLYLNRSQPVDIPKMRLDIKTLQHKIDQVAVRIIETPHPKDRDELEKQAEALKYDQIALQYRITELLSTCVEEQLKNYVQEYLVYLLLEEKTADGWQRHFQSYDDFMNCDDDDEDRLIYRATYYLSVLLYRDA